MSLLVGPQRVRVPAFSQILALSSDFFDAALGTSMVEAQTKEIALPDQDPETVRLLLEYVSPGSEVTLTAANILTLLPLLHQFQFSVGLKEADALCSGSGSMSWAKKAGVVGTPVALLQAGVDYCLDKTRAAAMKQINSDLRRGERFRELEPLATDGRYTEQMRELWPGIRALVLSPKQQADGVMAEPPDPACCEAVWPALDYSLARRNCLATVGASVYSVLPSGYFVRELAEGDDEDETTTINDDVVRALVVTYVSCSLPGHARSRPHLQYVSYNHSSTGRIAGCEPFVDRCAFQFRVVIACVYDLVAFAPQCVYSLCVVRFRLRVGLYDICILRIRVVCLW